MSRSFVVALWISLILCISVCLVTEKAYLDTDPTDTSIAVVDMLNIPFYVMAAKAIDVSFPVMAVSFFTGIWKILIWDYSFWKLNLALQIVKIVFVFLLLFWQYGD